jgi:hypothetical protein
MSDDEKNQIVGLSYPQRFLTDSGLARRYWLLRLQANDSNLSLDGLTEALRANVERSFAAEESATAREALLLSIPEYKLIRLGDVHVLLRVDFSGDETARNEMVAQWRALRLLHEWLPLEELQGLPVDLWFFLRTGVKTT